MKPGTCLDKCCSPPETHHGQAHLDGTSIGCLSVSLSALHAVLPFLCLGPEALGGLESPFLSHPSMTASKELIGSAQPLHSGKHSLCFLRGHPTCKGPQGPQSLRPQSFPDPKRRWPGVWKGGARQWAGIGSFPFSL